MRLWLFSLDAETPQDAQDALDEVSRFIRKYPGTLDYVTVDSEVKFGKKKDKVVKVTSIPTLNNATPYLQKYIDPPKNCECCAYKQMSSAIKESARA